MVKPEGLEQNMAFAVGDCLAIPHTKFITEIVYLCSTKTNTKKLYPQEEGMCQVVPL